MNDKYVYEIKQLDTKLMTADDIEGAIVSWTLMNMIY